MPSLARNNASELDRALGPWTSAAILAGTVIGTGIFLVPSTVAREVNSLGWVFFVWVLGGLLSLAGALSYAELGAAFPAAGGEYAFLRRAYGPLWGFLFGWQQIVIGKTGSIAGIATALAIFLAYFDADPNRAVLLLETGAGVWTLTLTQALALSGIALLTGINYLGVAMGGAAQDVLTVLKVGAILTLVAVTLGSGAGSWTHFAGLVSSPPPNLLAGLAGALSAVLWAYDGWNNLTMVGGEIRDPQRTIPRVLVGGLLGVLLVYVLTNLAYFYALPFEAVKQSQHLAQDVASLVVGEWGGTLLTLAAVVSTLGSLNGSILSGARVFYAMAHDGLFFRAAGAVHRGRHTPGNALILQGVLASTLVLLFGRDQGAFERLFDYALFGTWAFYGVTALAVVVLRYRHPDWPRPFCTPGYPVVPLIFVLVAALFCLSILMRRPAETGFGLVLLATGLPFYFYWRKAGRAA